MIRPAWLTLILLVAGCSRSSGNPPGRPELGAPSAASAAPAVAALSPPSSSPEPAAVDVAGRISRHYAKYVEGSSFEFLRDDWAPRVEKYLRLADVPVDALIQEARRFYSDKRHIALRVQPTSVALQTSNGRTVATFVLTMEWSRSPPTAARQCKRFDDSMQLQTSPVDRHVDVNAELTLDATGRFLAYGEHGLVPSHLRVHNAGQPMASFLSMPTEPARNDQEDAGGPSIPDGTVVDDLGETFTCGDESEIDTVHAVRFGGRDVWVLSGWSFNTGHSYVGMDGLLAPAP